MREKKAEEFPDWIRGTSNATERQQKLFFVVQTQKNRLMNFQFQMLLLLLNPSGMWKKSIKFCSKILLCFQFFQLSKLWYLGQLIC